MRTLQRAGAGLFALTLIAGTAACGDDDDKDAAGAENAAFCEAVVDFNTAAFQSDISDDSTKDEIIEEGTALAEHSQVIVDEAPEELKASAEEVHGFITPMLEGDAEPFNEDASFETYSAFLGEATSACAFPEVEVEAADYSFDAPDEIESGSVSFAFTNTSQGEEHEMIVLAKADGVDLSWEELLDLPEEEAMSKTRFVTAAFAPPGESGSTLATLEAGTYAMVCFVPVGGEEDGPPHFTQGMIHEFTVQ